MHRLRSKLLLVIVSLFVLTGYVHAMMDKCCDAKQAAVAKHGKAGPAKSAGCHCICHKGFSNASAVPARVPTVTFVSQANRLPTGEFPPDTEPQGIDYPPQLA